MTRGDVVIAGERGAFAGKPRPWLVVQNGNFLDEPSSVTVCMVSSTARPALFRVAVQPDAANNLDEPSMILADKIVTLRAASIDAVIGSVPATTMSQVDAALRYWLDL